MLFRLYGPEKPLFDKTWVLPDIEKLNDSRALGLPGAGGREGRRGELDVRDRLHAALRHSGTARSGAAARRASGGIGASFIIHASMT